MSDSVLSAEKLRALLKEFKEKRGAEYHLLSLGYFGSYARGEATAQSDVDIVFETNKPNLFTTVIMKQDLEALLGRPVDVIRLRVMMNPRMKARIIKEATYV
jgi:hypothetical protein